MCDLSITDNTSSDWSYGKITSSLFLQYWDLPWPEFILKIHQARYKVYMMDLSIYVGYTDLTYQAS